MLVQYTRNNCYLIISSFIWANNDYHFDLFTYHIFEYINNHNIMFIRLEISSSCMSYHCANAILAQVCALPTLTPSQSTILHLPSKYYHATHVIIVMLLLNMSVYHAKIFSNLSPGPGYRALIYITNSIPSHFYNSYTNTANIYEKKLKERKDPIWYFIQNARRCHACTSLWLVSILYL